MFVLFFFTLFLFLPRSYSSPTASIAIKCKLSVAQIQRWRLLATFTTTNSDFPYWGAGNTVAHCRVLKDHEQSETKKTSGSYFLRYYYLAMILTVQPTWEYIFPLYGPRTKMSFTPLIYSMWCMDPWFYCLNRNSCFPSQVWWRLHGDCQGRWLSASAEASRGFCPGGIPRQCSEGEASQHTAISVPLCAWSLGQHFQTVFQPAAEAGYRRLLCVPDHSGSGEAQYLGE